MPLQTCSDRETKDWWVALEGGVHHATGYRCQPGSPDYWWFPKLGFSIIRDKLFDNEKDATQKSIEYATERRDGWESALRKLQTRYSAL